MAKGHAGSRKRGAHARAAKRSIRSKRGASSRGTASSKHTAGSRRPKARSHAKGARRRWSHEVKTVSTFPPEGLYTKDAGTIARVMATKKVSPKGIGSGIRMVQFFINRAGRTLPASRRRELEKAKRLLQEKARDQREQGSRAA